MELTLADPYATAVDAWWTSEERSDPAPLDQLHFAGPWPELVVDLRASYNGGPEGGTLLWAGHAVFDEP